MSQFARVESVESLRELQVALVKFAESARSALTDADAELQHTLNWVQNEQRTYWQGQVQKRYQALMEAREGLRQKQLSRSSLQSKDSAAEERKALAMAQRNFDEAQAKAQATRAWGTKLAQEAILYRGMAQRLANQTDIRVPLAIGMLERSMQALATYLALEAPEAVRSPAAASGGERPAAVGLSPAGEALPDAAPTPDAKPRRDDAAADPAGGATEAAPKPPEDPGIPR
jgi:hypothetical protein